MSMRGHHSIGTGCLGEFGLPCLDHFGILNNVLNCQRLNIFELCSAFQYGFFKFFLGSEKIPELNTVSDILEKQYQVNNTTIAMVWLLRHPVKLLLVTGTMNTGRLLEYVKASDITLNRSEWYEIYQAAGNTLS